MNRYILIRRLRGPAFLLLVGVLALLNQADILSWGHSWPFFLILGGVMVLAERMALTAEGGAYPPAPYAGSTGPATGPTATSTSIVPAHSEEYEQEPNGGQQ